MEIGDSFIKRFGGKIRKIVLKFAECDTCGTEMRNIGGINADSVVNAGKHTPIVAVIGDMEIASVALAVIAHYTAADIVITGLTELFFNVVGNFADVFCDTVGIGKHLVVDALKDIFLFHSVDNRRNNVCIVDIAGADAGDTRELTL